MLTDEQVYLQEYKVLLHYGLGITKGNEQAAEDLISFAFLKYYETFPRPINYKSWLHTVVTNKFRQEFNSNKRFLANKKSIIHEIKVSNLETIVDDEVCILKKKTIFQKARQIKYYISRLDMPQRKKCLYLRYIKGIKSSEAIATLLKLSRNTIKTHLKLGNRYLKHKIQPPEELPTYVDNIFSSLRKLKQLRT